MTAALRLRMLVATSLIFLGGLVASAPAQDYPIQPITVILANAAGSQPDTIMRLLQPKMQELLGQLVTVESHDGAAGTIGANKVAHATPDGYTILFTTGSPITRNPFLQSDYPFDPLTDLAPLSRTSEVQAMMVASADAPFNTIEELVAYAKEHPGELTYSSAGIGSANHVVGELLNKAAGIEIVHVPYKGGAEVINALLGGHVTLSYGAAPVVIPHVNEGTLKLIASADPRRVPEYPGLPAIAEVYSGVEITSWHAFFAPGGTPQPVIDKLSEAIRAALNDGEVKERLGALGIVIVASTPDELGDWSSKEYNKLKDVIADLGAASQ
jgi:tripartite-type tricarboxylate transporter receptor subunit TctC